MHTALATMWTHTKPLSSKFPASVSTKTGWEAETNIGFELNRPEITRSLAQAKFSHFSNLVPWCISISIPKERRVVFAQIVFSYVHPRC